jgi:hypothetical protein
VLCGLLYGNNRLSGMKRSFIFISFLLNLNKFFYSVYSGVNKILNDSIPQPIPKMTWILTRRNSLPTLNIKLPILIGSKDSPRLMVAVIAKCIEIHEYGSRNFTDRSKHVAEASCQPPTFL